MGLGKETTRVKAIFIISYYKEYILSIWIVTVATDLNHPPEEVVVRFLSSTITHFLFSFQPVLFERKPLQTAYV